MTNIKSKAVWFALLVFLFQSISVFAQKNDGSSLILMVNGKLLIDNAIGLKLTIGDKDSVKELSVKYIPGHLLLDSSDVQRLQRASTATLSFDYYTYSKRRQMIANLKVDFSPKLLSQPYLIFHFYDFNDKEYKRLYARTFPSINNQALEHKDFAVDVEYPGSGWFQEQR